MDFQFGGKNTNPDHAGRIPKQGFIISVIFLLATAIIAACARFFIRIRYQKQVSVDDGFLLFGLCCIISSIGVIFVFIDNLYIFENIEFGNNPSIPPDFIEKAWSLQKYSAISLVLSWFAIVSVKFSFLFLFRKLIDRVRSMKIYWWVVLCFNAVISCYGISVYFIACPRFYVISDLKCGSGGPGLRTTHYAISQIVLDVIGDLMILFIPIHLLLQIQMRWTQKVAIFSSLGLTIIVIAVTIIKGSGIRRGGELDTVWEIYFQTISAEVALLMTAITAFRAFFVAKSHERSNRSPTEYSWLKQKLSPRYWLSKTSWRSTTTIDGDFHLAEVPGAQITGIRTYIEGSGRTDEERERERARGKGIGSRLGLRSESRVDEERGEDMWPLTPPRPCARSIMVQKDVSFFSERNSSSSEYMRGVAA